MPKRPDSSACSEARQCTSERCVDGVCCNLECQGQCQACDVQGSVGVCTDVGSPESPEAPHPNLDGSFQRPACVGVATGCSGYCTGASATECTYPGSDQEQAEPTCACPDPSCEVGPASETHLYCDGQGSAVEKVADCGGYRCADGARCGTGCTSDADCIIDFICEAESCEKLTGPKCDGDHTVRIPAAPDEDCTPYRCADEACLASCKSVGDCVPPAVCNAAGKCVAQLTAPPVESCSCRLPGGTPTRPRWPSALLLAAILGATLAGRRRAARANVRYGSRPSRRILRRPPASRGQVAT
jgi:hypothetical protein